MILYHACQCSTYLYMRCVPAVVVPSSRFGRAISHHLSFLPSLSIDLRWRLVWMKNAHNLPASEIAALLQVSECTVRRIVNLFFDTGDVKPKSAHHGPKKLLGEFEQLTLLQLILEHPGIYLCKIQAELNGIFGVQVSIPMICRTIDLIISFSQIHPHVLQIFRGADIHDSCTLHYSQIEIPTDGVVLLLVSDYILHT